MWPRALADPLQGRTSLRKVFWLYGVLVSLIYSMLGLLVDPAAPVILRLYTVLGIGVGIWQSVMLWQCAYNGRSRLVGQLVRISVVVGLIAVPVMLYVARSIGIDF